MTAGASSDFVTPPRWSWYRLLTGSTVSLNFIREDEGSGADQPTLLQWVNRRQIESLTSSGEPVRFAAVLGDPVLQSRSPMEHFDFFAARKASIFSIPMTESDVCSGACDFLRSLGMQWAAVTSPLKEAVFAICGERDEISQSLYSVNTLSLKTDSFTWRGSNTDREGFAQVISDICAVQGLGETAVWGGGGTLAVIKMVLPDSEFFSARTGENRVQARVSAKDFCPQTVVWAVGRSREATQQPPVSWRPHLVIDLNYSDDSPGREFAAERGCRYISGLAMFRYQAQAQRLIWSEKK
jgi:shikimate 5-dehydrogenase